MRKIIMFVCLAFSSLSANAASYEGDLPLFDAHLHYAGDDVAHFTPKQILQKFDESGVRYALISSTPNDGTEQLYHAAPQRILPFLGFYKSLREKGDWMWNEEVLKRVEQRLASFPYIGLGEFHIFKKDMNSPIFQELILLAEEKQLWLQFHGDAEVLDKIYEIAPDSRVLWAHLGTRPEPEFLRKFLNKYQGQLWIDTTVRDEQLLENNNQLTDDWKQLFIDFQDSFLVGVDTFSVNRWNHFAEVTERIRTWLRQLPPEVAQKLAYENAYGLFKAHIEANSQLGAVRK